MYLKRFAYYLLQVYIIKKKQAKTNKAKSKNKSNNKIKKNNKIKSYKDIIKYKVAKEKKNKDKSGADSDNTNNIAQQNKNTILVNLIKDYYKLTKLIPKQKRLL